MSLILDALRRAESERERGKLPGLRSDPGPADRADEAALPAVRRLWPLLLAALLLLAAGAWLAQWWRGDPAPAAATAQPAPPLAQPPVALGAEMTRLRLPDPASAPPVLEPPPLAPVPEPRIPKLQELPEALRRELPKLVAGGAMDSEQAAQRMLILNGQLLHEGDAVAPGLVLERIQLRTAQLVYKGQRFTIAY
ncbi:general secretion pathway protein GspB [Pelomonas sp. SE-A7]|uniref:general secretion pathway protein GspB n=1 Tax=Pelomonas sp. SE-A7 TaxID=3054953 RepID=UPI00259CE384|nr:general secretion pathway protein GspB [Pelomonas sp. SE-A7]MDM4768158.1 general secretion pathway protein GspB [Pelomonas sp. SE-A7]